MYVNADFAQRASITSEQYQWVASPQGGVERMMLDRLGAEKARAVATPVLEDVYAKVGFLPPLR